MLKVCQSLCVRVRACVCLSHVGVQHPAEALFAKTRLTEQVCVFCDGQQVGTNLRRPEENPSHSFFCCDWDAKILFESPFRVPADAAGRSFVSFDGELKVVESRRMVLFTLISWVSQMYGDTYKCHRFKDPTDWRRSRKEQKVPEELFELRNEAFVVPVCNRGKPPVQFTK